MTTQMVTPPTGSSLQRLAEQSWDRLGARSVLHYEGGQWTGDQLAERVRRVAGGLREAGLRPGERVVVCMANCPEVSITYDADLAGRRGGHAGAVPAQRGRAAPRAGRQRRGPGGHDAGIPAQGDAPQRPDLASVRGIVVVGEPRPRRGRRSAGTPLLPFAELEAAPPAELVDADPSGLAALLYTGGTTGRSKGVMISHDALSAAAWAATATSYDEAAARPCSRCRCPTSTG